MTCPKEGGGGLGGARVQEGRCAVGSKFGWKGVRCQDWGGLGGQWGGANKGKGRGKSLECCGGCKLPSYPAKQRVCC